MEKKNDLFLLAIVAIVAIVAVVVLIMGAEKKASYASVTLEDNVGQASLRTATRISISSYPSNVDIYLDGKYSGRKTPAQISTTPGTHRVQLFVFEYQPSSDYVNVAANKVTYFGKNLTSINASCIEMDGGIVPNEFGACKSHAFAGSDGCLSTTQLSECYCNGGNQGSYAQTTVECQNGCRDGACIKPTRQEKDYISSDSAVVSGEVEQAIQN